MPPSIRIRVTEKQSKGPCGLCEYAIEAGTIHATIIVTLGQSKGGKTRYRSAHTHMVCVPKWLLIDHVRYQTRRRGNSGRPKGSGIKVDSEGRRRRKWLIRTRARLVRAITQTDDKERMGTLYGRIIDLQMELRSVGGERNTNMVRRGPDAEKQLRDKLMIARREWKKHAQAKG